MISALVTGANGQLGKTLRFLGDHKALNGNYHFYDRTTLDITNIDQLRRLFREKKITHCINCAAYTNVDRAETHIEKALKVNSYGPKQIVEVCKEFHTILIQISTDYVFDGNSTMPYKTQDKTNPINFYGNSKLLGERAIIENHNYYYIIRTSWLYSIYENNFLDFVLKNLRNGKALEITTENTGTPTSCLSLGKYINFLVNAKQIPFGIYHFSNIGSTTWLGFAAEISKLITLPQKGRLKATPHYNTLAQRPKYSVLNLSKTLRFYPKIQSWQEALYETMQLRNKLYNTK